LICDEPGETAQTALDDALACVSNKNKYHELVTWKEKQEEPKPVHTVQYCRTTLCVV
jgi:hypothetical protein